MSKRGGSQYPLPHNYFHCPELTPAHADSLTRLGKKALRSFLDKTLYPDDNLTWNYDSDCDGVKLFEGSIASKGLHLNKATIPYRALGKISATVEEVAALHEFDTRDKCLQYIKHLAPDLVDMIPLYTLLEPSVTRPHRRMFVKWSAGRSPMPMIKDRDFVYLESQDDFVFASGRRGWGFCQYSIELPFAPCLRDTTLGLIRGTLYHTGMVFLESDTPGVLDVIYHIASDFKGSIPHWVRRMGIKRRAQQITHLNEHLHTRRVSTRPAKHYSLGSGRRSTKCVHCGTCVRFRVGGNCKSCNEPVCSKCSRNWRVQRESGDVHVRVCNSCASSAQDASLWESSSSMYLSSTLSSSRSGSSAAKTDERFEADNLQILYESVTPGRERFLSIDDGLLTMGKPVEGPVRNTTAISAVDLSYLSMYGGNVPCHPDAEDPATSSAGYDEDDLTKSTVLSTADDPKSTATNDVMERYPLSDTFFPVPELSDNERTEYLRVGENALATFLNNVLGPVNPTLVWRPFGEFDGVKIVEADVPGFKVDRNLLPYRMTARIHGTIDEVAMLHASDTRQHCAEYVEQHSGNILDVIPLYSLLERSEANPYKQCYIKWSAHLSAVALIRDRDYVFVEMQDIVDLPSGRRGWAYCRVSIDLMSVMSLERTHLKLVRGVLHHYGAIFSESSTPGMLDVVMQMATDAKGSIPQWVRKLGMKNNVRHITLVEDYVHKLRMSSRISKGNSFLSTSSASTATATATTSTATATATTSTATSAPGNYKRCALCDAPSSPFKRFKSCESCGDLVCHRCSSLWNVNVKGKPRVRVCTACANDAQKGAWEIHDLDGTATSSSRETLVELLSSQRSSTAVSSQRGPAVATRVVTDTITAAALDQHNQQQTPAPAALGELGVDLSYLSVYNKKPDTASRASLAAAMDSVVYAGGFDDDSDDRDVTCSTLDSVQSIQISKRSFIRLGTSTWQQREIHLQDDGRRLCGERPMNHKRYPVPTAIFHCPPLPPADAEQYVTLGHTTFAAFLDALLEPDSNVRWSPLGEVDHVQVYEGEIPGLKLDRHTLPYRAIGRLHATLEEVAALHNFDSREKCLQYIYEYAGDIVDMMPLYTLTPTTGDSAMHRMYLKWVACATPVPMVRDRDFVFLETQNTFERDGRRGWAFCQYSVDLACCPSLKDTELNLVRGTLHYTGGVFMETADPDVLDVVYHLASNFKGHVPVLLRKIHIRNRAARKITSIEDYVARSRYNVAKRGASHRMDPDRCAVCAHGSGRLHRLHPCDGCHLPVCAHCSRRWSRKLICQVCAAGVRQDLVASMRGDVTASSRTLSSVDSVSSSSSSDGASPRQTLARLSGRSTEVDLSYLNLYRNGGGIPEEGVSPVSSSCVMSIEAGCWDEDEVVASNVESNESSKPHPGLRELLSRIAAKVH
ncbi:hypothetical protein ACHHYP_11319 [Achlya hypogyna]|uniref:FYVE-type domain-containing protein n=1 Tax=Achlya hypogyna TaxID=1202772 RepID=A0A1V9YJC8_ACHHY|nr:hypothetical protein ACHHYP_11319 [Achlya hypogyna]